MIHVIVRERDAAAQATEPITSGSVGLEVMFRFSPDWNGLGKAAIFKGSGTTVDVALTGNSCVVPHEVLASAGGHLKIGVYGTGSQGQKVTPTVWADAGPIREGAEPSEVDPTPATESLVQQILEAVEAAQDAAEIAQSVRDDADSGAFDGAQGPKGDKGDKGDIGATGPSGQDGADGNSLWQYDPSALASIGSGTDMYFDAAHLLGRTSVDPQIGDIVYYNDPVFGKLKAYQIAEFIVLSNTTQCRSTYLNDVTGAKGATGAAGTAGQDGATFTPAVSAAGVLSWSNDGNRQNPASVDLVAAVLAALPAVTEVTNSSTGDVTLALDAGKSYHFTGAISSLTLTLNAPASGQLAQYHFDFDSGSTAATVSITGVTWPGGSFTPSASKHYEVDILNGYGVVCEW